MKPNFVMKEVLYQLCTHYTINTPSRPAIEQEAELSSDNEVGNSLSKRALAAWQKEANGRVRVIENKQNKLKVFGIVLN